MANEKFKSKWQMKSSSRMANEIFKWQMKSSSRMANEKFQMVNEKGDSYAPTVLSIE
jgi:hypothetical protein